MEGRVHPPSSSLRHLLASWLKPIRNGQNRRLRGGGAAPFLFLLRISTSSSLLRHLSSLLLLPSLNPSSDPVATFIPILHLCTLVLMCVPALASQPGGATQILLAHPSPIHHTGERLETPLMVSLGTSWERSAGISCHWVQANFLFLICLLLSHSSSASPGLGGGMGSILYWTFLTISS